MLGRIDEVVIDCADPGLLAGFWAGVLGGTPQERDPNWWYLDAPGWTRLAFQRVPEVKTVKNRLHLDVDVADIATATAMAEAEELAGWAPFREIGPVHFRCCSTLRATNGV